MLVLLFPQPHHKACEVLVQPLRGMNLNSDSPNQWTTREFRVCVLVLFVTPWTVANQALLSMGFPRQEYWSGMPFSSPGDLPDPGIELACLALAGRFFTS